METEYLTSTKSVVSAHRKGLNYDPAQTAGIEFHLCLVLERFRPKLESRLFQQLPLWYLANYLCLKWQVAQPEWLMRVNCKYITWTIVQAFLPDSLEERNSAKELLKTHAGDAPMRGRHAKPGTAAGSTLECIRTLLSYKYAELVNDHYGLALTKQDLKLQIARFLSVSDETLRARMRKAKQYFEVPQTNSDAIIFRVDVKGIKRALTGKSREG